MKKDPISASVEVLKKDKYFGPLIKKHGPPELKRGTNVFEALVRSIVYQQLSGKAAATIYGRFRTLFTSKKFPTPEEVSKVPFEKLRSVGLSNQKASYILDLAAKFADGTIEHKKLSRMTNEEIVAHLVQVKGVGVWTVHMFLMFTLNRPDVLPVGDLGIKKGFQIVYKLRTMPEAKKMEKLASAWRPHATTACWYLWRAADEKK
ncbi:DNA-3-methyladenine glycosylase [Candidatus Parcubacteria bacterium]|nr:DNA-3-methyladenine glycosylase [Candidatus Parcubacteria bacterium]